MCKTRNDVNILRFDLNLYNQQPTCCVRRSYKRWRSFELSTFASFDAEHFVAARHLVYACVHWSDDLVTSKILFKFLIVIVSTCCFKNQHLTNLTQFFWYWSIETHEVSGCCSGGRAVLRTVPSPMERRVAVAEILCARPEMECRFVWPRRWTRGTNVAKPWLTATKQFIVDVIIMSVQLRLQWCQSCFHHSPLKRVGCRKSVLLLTSINQAATSTLCCWRPHYEVCWSMNGGVGDVQMTTSQSSVWSVNATMCTRLQYC